MKFIHGGEEVTEAEAGSGSLSCSVSSHVVFSENLHSGSLSCSVSSHVVFSENLQRMQENEWNV